MERAAHLIGPIGALVGALLVLDVLVGALVGALGVLGAPGMPLQRSIYLLERSS